MSPVPRKPLPPVPRALAPEPPHAIEGLHLRTDRPAAVIEAVTRLAGERGLTPMDVPLAEWSDILGWRVVVSNARLGWVSVYSDVLVRPAEVLLRTTGELACDGLVVGGQVGVLWGFALASHGALVGEFRSDLPDEAELREALVRPLTPLLRSPASPTDLNALLAARAWRETDAVLRFLKLVGIVNPFPGFTAAAPVAARGGTDALGHVLRSFGRPELVPARKTLPALEPVAPEAAPAPLFESSDD